MVGSTGCRSESPLIAWTSCSIAAKVELTSAGDDEGAGDPGAMEDEADEGEAVGGADGDEVCTAVPHAASWSTTTAMAIGRSRRRVGRDREGRGDIGGLSQTVTRGPADPTVRSLIVSLS